jgi:hypothetical protein
MLPVVFVCSHIDRAIQYERLQHLELHRQKSADDETTKFLSDINVPGLESGVETKKQPHSSTAKSNESK